MRKIIKFNIIFTVDDKAPATKSYCLTNVQLVR